MRPNGVRRSQIRATHDRQPQHRVPRQKSRHVKGLCGQATGSVSKRTTTSWPPAVTAPCYCAVPAFVCQYSRQRGIRSHVTPTRARDRCAFRSSTMICTPPSCRSKAPFALSEPRSLQATIEHRILIALTIYWHCCEGLFQRNDSILRLRNLGAASGPCPRMDDGRRLCTVARGLDVRGSSGDRSSAV
jgi:hypothetical protein